MISIYCKFCIISQQRSYLLDQIYRILFFTTFTNYDVNMTTASCQLTLQFLTMFNRAVQRTTARPASPSRRCHSPPHRNFRYHRPYHRRDQQRAPTRLHSSAHPPAPRLWRWSQQNPRQVDRTFLDSSMSPGLKGHIGILIIHQDSYCTWKGRGERVATSKFEINDPPCTLHSSKIFLKLHDAWIWFRRLVSPRTEYFHDNVINSDTFSDWLPANNAFTEIA